MEAKRFAEEAPRFVATETLRQTASTGSHQVISEYGLVLVPTGMREVRRVLSVDGKAVKPSKKLDSLALVAGEQEEDRRKLLEALEKHGLQGVATDFGPLILLFAQGNLQKFEFSGGERIAIAKQIYRVIRYQQLDGTEALTIFEGSKPVKQQLKGEIWFRETDGRPVRITLDAAHADGEQPVRDVTAVDYQPGPGGLLLPAMIVHRQFRNARLHVQDAFRYSEYRETGSPTAK